MLRILCIGDPHFQDSTRLRQEEFIEKTVDLAEELQPDRIVIMGDTLDRFKTINQYNLHNALTLFKRLSDISPLMVLIGNHDRPNHDDFMGSIHPFEAIELFGKNSRVTIVSKTLSIYEQVLDKDLVYVPYVTVGRFTEALEYGNVNLENVYCIFAHQEFKGSDYRGIKSGDGDDWSQSHPYVISGHIHKYQRLGENIVYVGAPIQFSQDEEVGKTVSLFICRPNLPPEEERYSLKCKEYKSVNMTVKELMEWKYDPSYHWSITINDYEGELKLLLKSNLYKHLKKEGVSIKIHTKTVVTLNDIKNTLNEQTVDYYLSLSKRIAYDQLMLKQLQKCNDESV